MRRRIAHALQHPVIMICTEFEQVLPQAVIVVCVGDDKKSARAISTKAMEAIPTKFRSTAKRFKRGTGVNICRGRIVGEDEFARLSFEATTDFIFSVEDSVLRHYLPKTATHFT